VRLAIVERVLYVLAAIFLGWYALQHAITAYQQAAANRELESVHMVVDKPAAAGRRPSAGTGRTGVDVERISCSGTRRVNGRGPRAPDPVGA